MASFPATKAKGDNEKQEAIKARLVQKFSAKSPVYENCRMLSQDGELLCHCDRRKLNWYVHKGLADFVDGDGLTIKLKFRHKNSDKPDSGASDFYASSKSNECVVCGETEHYLRYRIVPSCYRRNFPTHLKSHRSHDIVLVCIPCHENAQRSADEVKRELAAEHDLPLNPPPIWPPTAAVNSNRGNGTSSAADDPGGCDDDDGAEHQVTVAIPEANQKTGIHGFSARRAAQALGQHAPLMPDTRRVELMNLIKLYLGRDPTQEPPCLQPGDLVDARVAGVTARRRRRVIQQLAKELGPAPHPDLGVTSGPALLEEEAAMLSASNGGGNSSSAGGHAVDAEAEAEDGSAALADDPQAPSSSTAKQQSKRSENLERNGGHGWHGEQIVAVLLETGGDEALLGLVRRFRERFVERLQPLHLPSGWAVAHQAPREFGPYSIFYQDGHGDGDEEDATDEPLVADGREDGDSPPSSSTIGKYGDDEACT